MAVASDHDNDQWLRRFCIEMATQWPMRTTTWPVTSFTTGGGSFSGTLGNLPPATSSQADVDLIDRAEKIYKWVTSGSLPKAA